MTNPDEAGGIAPVPSRSRTGLARSLATVGLFSGIAGFTGFLCLFGMMPVFDSGEYLHGVAALNLLFALTLAGPVALVAGGAAAFLSKRDARSTNPGVPPDLAVALGVVLCVVQVFLLGIILSRESHPFRSFWEDHVLKAFTRPLPTNAVSQDFALGGDVLAGDALARHPEVAVSGKSFSWGASKSGAGRSTLDYNLYVLQGTGPLFDAEVRRIVDRRRGEQVVLDGGTEGTFYPGGKRTETDPEDGPRQIDVWPRLAWHRGEQWYVLDRPDVSLDNLKREANTIIADTQVPFLGGALQVPRSYLMHRPPQDLRWVAGDVKFKLEGVAATLSIRHNTVPPQGFLCPPDAKRTDRVFHGVRYAEYETSGSSRGLCVCFQPRDREPYCRIYRLQADTPDATKWRRIADRVLPWIVEHEERGK